MDKVTTVVNSWHHSTLSLSGRVVLINSRILPTLTYFLSFYSIPDTTINDISKLVRKFLWSAGGSNWGYHSVGWSLVTQNKSEGELGIINLSSIEYALMSKNVFAILISEDKLWVDIF